MKDISMRDALMRESGYIVLALICAVLAVVSIVRINSARNQSVVEVADYKPPVSALIDINSADAALLTSLPGVGEKTAERIIESRPYRSIEDLLNVEGIGEKTLNGMRDRIRVGDQ